MTYRLRNIGLAIALAAVAVLLVFYYVAQERGRLQEDQELVSVWVATKDIPAGTAGAELQSGGYVEEKEVERAALSSSALLDPEDVTGKVVVNQIYKGEQVNVLRFRSESQRGVRAQISGNLRAIEVPGGRQQLLAGTLQAGDHIDIVATIKYKFVNFGDVPEGTSNEELTATRVVLRDILVLRPPQSTTVARGISEGGPNQSLSALLAVTDAQSQKLHFVTRPDGPEWTFALRPPADSADSPESVETVATVLLDGLKGQQIAVLVPGRSSP
jgi:Flp pilus assembly protein CpaB